MTSVGSVSLQAPEITVFPVTSKASVLSQPEKVQVPYSLSKVDAEVNVVSGVYSSP